jgi:hypothetical protein
MLNMTRRAQRAGKARIWYAVHFILVIEHVTKRKRWPRYFAYENVYLVRARTPAEARRKGEVRGRGEVIEDETLRWDRSPARYVYGGVRKVISCEANVPRPGDGVRVIGDGDEATYSVFIVPNRAALRRLVSGESVTLEYAE